MSNDNQTCLFTPHHVGVIVSDLEAAMDGCIVEPLQLSWALMAFLLQNAQSYPR